MIYIKEQLRGIKKLPFVSAIWVLINVIVFILCTFTGDLLYNKGSVGLLYLVDGEYYRLITSMFLHTDANHLVNNMILIFAIGYMIECEIGHIRFALIYIIAGVAGNLLSAVVELMTGDFIVSVGASGAAFGLDGMLLALVLISGKQISNVTVPRVLFMIVYSLYNGFTAENINNAAHIGGLMAGFVLTAFSCVVRRIKATYLCVGGRTEDKDEY